MTKKTYTSALPWPDASIRLEDGRVARVVYKHHASPRERWQMWQTLRAVAKEAKLDGAVTTRRERRKMTRMFLATVLDPNCQACWYEIETP